MASRRPTSENSDKLHLQAKRNTVEMPVATLCADASSGSARVPEPAIHSSRNDVSFVTLETRSIKDFEPAAAKTLNHGTKYRPTTD